MHFSFFAFDFTVRRFQGMLVIAVILPMKLPLKKAGSFLSSRGASGRRPLDATISITSDARAARATAARTDDGRGDMSSLRLVARACARRAHLARAMSGASSAGGEPGARARDASSSEGGDASAADRGDDHARSRGSTAAAAESSSSSSSSSKSSSSESEPGTAGAAAEDAARAAREAAGKFTSWASGAASRAREASGGKIPPLPPRASSAMQTIANAFKEEYRLAMMDPGDAAEERRKQRPGYVAPGPMEEGDGTTAVAVRTQTKSTFAKGWEAIATKTGLTSVFSKLQGLKRTPAYQKTEDALEDLRERWETSENPMVHKIQDSVDGFFQETEQGEAYRAIRARAPTFNINDFLAEVRRDVPKILGAYLKGDVDALAMTNVSNEMMERMSGQMRAWEAERKFVDPRVLHLGDVELVETRMMEGAPLVVTQFQCQQINCVRDASGVIVEGAEDDIQAVHYLWAMQLVDKELVAADGRKYVAPTWVLREMMLRGMMAVAA